MSVNDECQVIPQIIQGERKELTVTLLNSKTGEAIDISGATEIQAVFQKGQNVGGGYLNKKLEKAGVAEVTEITAVGDSSSSLVSKYFILNSPSSKYAFYFRVNGIGNAPTLSGYFTIPVDVNENDLAVDVAEALRVAINNQADFSAIRSNEIVTATNQNQGEVVDPQDFGTGFSFSVTTEGVTEIVDSVETIGTGQLKVKLSKSETPLLLAGLRQTFHIAVDFPDVSTGRKIFKIKDAYDVCETDFSLD
jgi:hypothetical protein